MSEAQAQPNHIKRATVLWAILTALALLVYVVIAPQLSSWGVLPKLGSKRLDEVNTVLWLFTLLAIPVFTLVVVYAGYAVFTFRSRGRPSGDGPSMPGDRRIQRIWIISTILLAAFLFGYGLYFLGEVQAAPTGNVLQINVTGEQWLWNYTYPKYNISSTELYLPVNQAVTFDITSLDVQHSFWIPSFGIKQDAVPGEHVKISVTPSELGDYVVRCAELCGLYHAYMETPVHVVTATEFETWEQGQQSIQVTPQAFAGPTLLAAVTNTTRRRASVASGSVGAA
ncbi:MAG TPA: cytochrome c oxidase subunit II [Ktedonobacterales bacterium]|nr:cytochrome c oxidase subunit II [Ktedonobacterales bacterium]